MKRVLKVVGFCSLIFIQNSCIASDYDEDNTPEDTRTLEELEQCPCVQEYVFQKYGEDLTASAKQQKKKKKKKKKTRRGQQNNNSSYSNEDDFSQNQASSSRRNNNRGNNNKGRTAQNGNRQQQQGNSRRQKNNNRGNSRNQNGSSSSQTRNRNNGSDSWMHETAWMNVKNPFVSANLLAQNDTSSSDVSNGKKGVEVLKDLKIKAKNFERPKYKINEKESIRFRQELEKYRQALA